MYATGGPQGFRSKNWVLDPPVARESQAGASAEVTGGMQQRGRARRRRRGRRQHGRQRARARRRGRRALHVRARARRHGSAARQDVLRLRRPAVVRQPAPHHHRNEPDQQRQHYVHLCVPCIINNTSLIVIYTKQITPRVISCRNTATNFTNMARI